MDIDRFGISERQKDIQTDYTMPMLTVDTMCLGKLYKRVPRFADIPERVGGLLVRLIAVNSGYTSRVIVSGAIFPSALQQNICCNLLYIEQSNLSMYGVLANYVNNTILNSTISGVFCILR